MKTKNYKFDKNSRYITKGIMDKIPAKITVKLWWILDEFIETKLRKDYLQIFELKISNQMISIVHRQEEPAYEMVFSYKVIANEEQSEDTIQEFKIYVIDDIDHSTMLLAEEY
jgi:hypothetical protein